MNHFRIPTTPTFCGVCGGPPDQHYPDCPVLTGEPQVGGTAALAQLYGPLLQQAGEQNMMGMGSLSALVDFVGGPLDGPNQVHPMQNYILKVGDDDSGYYEYLADGRYHWIKKQ